jgi:outer membrane protein assembly factor BamB
MVSSTAAVAEGCVYFQCGGLYCLDAMTGKLLWEFWQEDWAVKSPAVVDGIIYTVMGKIVFCIEAKTGKTIWNVALQHGISAPTVAQGYIYVSGDDELYCLKARTGELVWKISTEIRAFPVVSQGRVFITDRRKLYCLDAQQGTVLWSTDLDAVFSRLAVAGNRVFVRAATIYCFDAESGKCEWNSIIGKRLAGIPLISESALYVRNYDNRVYCLNPATGAKHWDIQVPAERWTIANGNIFISSTDYTIYCLRIPK